MERVAENIVDLTEEEQQYSMLFDAMLDNGVSCVDAARNVATMAPHLSAEFISWLRD